MPPVRTIGLPIKGLDDHDSIELDELHVPNLRNVRSDRSRIVAAPGGILMAPVPIPASGASAGVIVGSFTKATVTGVQAITHSLGATPGALILWTNAEPQGTAGSDNFFAAYGITDSTTSRSICGVSKDDEGTTNTSRRYAAKALTVVRWGESLQYECDWSAWTSTTFSLNWTTNNTDLDTIYYMLIGGAGLSAKVLEWTFSTTSGNQAVTGVGFAPQIVLHFFNSLTATGSSADNRYGVGAMVSSTAQWTASGADRDAEGISSCSRVHSSASAISMAPFSGTTPSYTAACVSLDADGFTVNWSIAPASAFLGASLCLAGLGNVKVGSFAKSTASAPVDQAVTGVGFEPTAVGFVQSERTASASAAGGVHQGFGASNVSGTGAISGASEDGVSVSDTTTNGRTSAAVINHKGGGTNLIATLKSVDTDGFTLNWTANDTEADTIFYFALRFSTSVMSEVGVIRNYGDLIVGGATPTEKLIMLTSKSAFVYAASTPTTGIWNSTAEAYTGTVVQRFSIANSTDATYGAVAAWSQGTNNLRYYNGTIFGALITAGTNHAARTLLAFNNRIVSVRPLVAGVDLKTQIRWSVNGDFANWSGAGSGTLEVVETSNQPLTGGFVLGSRCYLTRAREVIELIATGSLTPVFIAEPRVSGIGCIATHSIAAGDVYAFFLGPDEVYQWDGSQLRAVGGRTYNTITQYVDYQNLDQIQGVVYRPNAEYWLLVPPYIFIYDYRRDIWYWDDSRSYEAIGSLEVADVFTGDIDHSEFIVIGDSSVQTIRADPSLNTYLGAPIDSYFETKDFTPLTTLRNGQYGVSYDAYNSAWRFWFRSTPNTVYEVGISNDKGLTYPTLQTVTANAAGVGIAFFDKAFGVVRFRVRSQAGSAYSVQGPMQYEWTPTGVMLPP